MLTAIIPILMIVIGALMYALCVNPKLVEIGRLALASGLFAVAFAYAGKLVTLLGHG